MTDYRVATDLRGHTVVEANITCINGLRAWVMVADLGKEQPEDEMFGGFDREAIGDCIVKAMSSAPDKRVQRISDALEQAGRAAGFHSVARQFIGMAQQELRALAPGVGVWGPEHPDWKSTHGCTRECRQGAQCKCDDEAKAAADVAEVPRG